jgi:cell division protein FtsB
MDEIEKLRRENEELKREIEKLKSINTTRKKSMSEKAMHGNLMSRAPFVIKFPRGN